MRDRDEIQHQPESLVTEKFVGQDADDDSHKDNPQDQITSDAGNNWNNPKSLKSTMSLAVIKLEAVIFDRQKNRSKAQSNNDRDTGCLV